VTEEPNAGIPEVMVNAPVASSAAAENADEPNGVTEEEREDWLGDEGEEDELQEVQRTAEEAAIIILDGDDDEDGEITNWDSGAPVRPPQLNPEGKEDLEAWKLVTFTHTLKRAKANYTVQADYIMENMRVYIENFPLRIAAYYDPVDGLDLMRSDLHKMGKCLGPESLMCEHCIHHVAVYTKEERVDIAVRCWGFFYLPNHKEEFCDALLRTQPMELREVGRTPARGEHPEKVHKIAWHGEQLMKFYIENFSHVSVQTMALERALGFAKRVVFKASVSFISCEAILMIYNRGRTLLSGNDLTSGMQQEYREKKAAKKERTLAKAAKGILQKSRFYDKVGDVSEVLRKVEEKEEGAREKRIVQDIVQFRSRCMKFFGQPLVKVKAVFKKYMAFLMGSDETVHRSLNGYYHAVYVLLKGQKQYDV